MSAMWAGAANAPCVTTGDLWTDAHASCSALLCFLQGADVRKQRGATPTGIHRRRPPHVIAVPASDRPPLAVTFSPGGDWGNLQDSCADRRVFHYC